MVLVYYQVLKNNLHVIEYYNITIFVPPKFGNRSLNVTWKTVFNAEFLTAANIHPVHRLVFINITIFIMFKGKTITW